MKVCIAEKAVQYPGTTFIVPKVFALDSPMDKAQCMNTKRQIERNYNEVGVNEGKWIIERYKKLYCTQ
jgi:hypothetical protein